MKTVITESGMLTPYGLGTDACWQGLLLGDTALKPVDRFSVAAFNSPLGGSVSGIGPGASVVSQLLEMLFAGNESPVPDGAPLLLATTTGEVDLIERAVLANNDDSLAGALDQLLAKTCRLLNARAGGMIVSSACTSSTAALAQGASMIGAGETDCVFVVGCDALTEFVFSGFSSLMALDASGAHPFDAGRRGLSVGEAAGYAVLMSEARAIRENRTVLGEIAGWGLSNDANHMTGPSRDGSGLARSIDLALNLAEIDGSQIASISAHGTGTLYNDAMEMLAFKQVFASPRPLYSIKGGLGHTMGATGIIEALLVLKSFQEDVIPPTVGLREPDPAALGWVSTEAVEVTGNYGLSTNAGFGGVNAALVLRKPGMLA